MRKLGSAAWLFICLIGCSATPDKVRESPPRQFETSRSPDLVVSCLYEKYDGMGLLPMLSTVPRGDGGKTVKVMVSHTIKLLVDISPRAGGSSIRAYENFAVLPRERKIVSECGTDPAAAT